MTQTIRLPTQPSILEHALKAVESVEVVESPFPHIIMRDFLPSDVYSQLLELIPPTGHYESFSYNKHSDQEGTSNRKRFCLESSWLENLPRSGQHFWTIIRETFTSKALKESVFKKLHSGLALRFGCDSDSVGQLPGFAKPDLFQETDGYSIKPHPDTRKKVVTMQLSLAHDDNHSNLGTEFYRRSLHPLSWTREPKGFDIVKTTPFLPNAAFAFVVLNSVRVKSWHGRTALPEGSPVRNSLLNIWYRDPQDSRDALRSENQDLTLSKAG